MKIVDTCNLRNKKVEKMLRDLDKHVDLLEHDGKPMKERFMNIFMLTLELFIESFKQMENNTAPGKTLMDYTGEDIRNACNRVGEAKNFDDDHNYVIAVLQELTK